MCQSCGCGTVAPDAAGGSRPRDDGASRRAAGPEPVPAASNRPLARQDPAPARLVKVERDLLEKNDAVAAATRAWCAERGIVLLNVLSSPGAGKTSVLERAIADLGGEMAISVIEGDQATDADAVRIRRAGARATQINTGAGCHLDAAMVAQALRSLEPPARSVVVIENVGNLICPALFDLGERAKLVVASVTEGEDKPLKYPHVFRAAALALLNKIDLLPHVVFDADRWLAHARAVNPGLRAFRVSATRGDGLDAWYGWIRAVAASAGEASLP
jgi:hydrogenase nickel incorporation protein HypB